MTDLYSSETLMQLFVQGPTWDGNLVSKQERAVKAARERLHGQFCNHGEAQ